MSPRRTEQPDWRRGARPLSGLDAVFLYAESPAAPLNVHGLVICDPATAPEPVTFDRMVGFLAERTADNPVFRRRLAEVPMHLYHPLWIEDPYFDITNHVQHVALPAPGDNRALWDLVGRLSGGLLDRRYPLWRAWYIEGLERGRIALFFTFHHAAVDGITGANLLTEFLDLDAAATVRAAAMAGTGGDPVPAADTASILPRRRPRHAVPTGPELLEYAGRALARQPELLRSVVRRTAGGVRQLAKRGLGLRDPDRVAPVGAPPTPFNHPVGPRRRFAATRLSLERAKAVRRATGAKLNDVILAICSGALRHYLADRGELPDQPLVVMVPVSVHDPEGSGDGHNHVTSLWASLATDLDDPRQRLDRIQATTRRAKRNLTHVGPRLLEAWAEFGAAPLVRRAVRWYRSSTWAFRVPIHNVVVSNVPGPPVPLYIAGCRIEAVYPMGPVFHGMGLNITVFSINDSLDFGLTVDPELLPDVDRLAAAFAPALEELAAACGVAATKRTPPAKSKPRSLGTDPLARLGKENG